MRLRPRAAPVYYNSINWTDHYGRGDVAFDVVHADNIIGDRETVWIIFKV